MCTKAYEGAQERMETFKLNQILIISNNLNYNVQIFGRMDEKTIIMVEKYLSLEPMTDVEKKGLEKMLLSETFKEDVLWMKDFLVAINDVAKQDLKSKMGLWNEELELAELGGSAEIDDMDQIPTAALEVIFAPQQQYEIAIQHASRNKAFEVLSPINGFEWKTNDCSFELEGLIDSKIQYVIENNQMHKIQEGEVVIVDGKFMLSLSLPETLPGKYYLKLISDKEMVLQSFYIQKKHQTSSFINSVKNVYYWIKRLAVFGSNL